MVAYDESHSYDERHQPYIEDHNYEDSGGFCYYTKQRSQGWYNSGERTGWTCPKCMKSNAPLVESCNCHFCTKSETGGTNG